MADTRNNNNLMGSVLGNQGTTHSATLKGRVNQLDEIVQSLKDELKFCIDR